MTRTALRTTLLALSLTASLPAAPAGAQQPAGATAGRTVRVVGVVRDQQNAIALPGVPVEVVGGQTVYTDVDGRYVLELRSGHAPDEGRRWTATRSARSTSMSPPDTHATVDVGAVDGRVHRAGHRRRPGHRRRDVVGRGAAHRAQERSGHHRQRRRAGDEAQRRLATPPRRCRASPACRSSTTSTCSSAASASATATRRWPARCCRRPSRTRRSCRSTCSRRRSIDSVQVSKSYSPDRSAEFAGGLVQIVPLKLPSRPVVRLLLRLRASTRPPPARAFR